MSSQDVQMLRQGYDAFARQDIDGVLAFFAHDMDWVTPDTLPFGGHFVGHDEVAGFFQKLSEYWDELSVAPQQFVDGGETIVVLGRAHGRAQNGTMDLPFVHVWTLRDGRAASFREYIDTARVNEILGAPAASAT
jgi:ketosteroid isomerase-like protein